MQPSSRACTDVRLTVLGCSGTFPGPASPCSSYLFEHEGFRLVVDVGNGSTGPLQDCCNLLDLDAVIVTHLHGDHYLDLVTYTYARRYHPDGTPPPLPVYGPPEMRQHLASAFGDHFDTTLLDATYTFGDVRAAVRELGPFRIETVLMNHPVECFGLRISAGGSTVAYSADTGRCDALVDLARGADLFLCEASYLEGADNPPDIHLTGKEAGEYAARAGVGQLLLTHLVPWGDRARTHEEATREFDGPTQTACTAQVHKL